MQRTNIFKTALNIVGLALSIISIAYLFYTQRDSIYLLAEKISPTELLLIVFCTLIFSFCIYFVSSLAWRILVNRLTQMSKMKSFFVVCRSQIHKYIVGNFMHHVTRALLMKGYVCAKDYGKLIILESSLLTIAGIILLCGFLIAEMYFIPPEIGLLGALVVPLISYLSIAKKFRFYFVATGLHAVTFALNSLCLLAIIALLGGEIKHTLIVLFAFTAAFLSGFLALGSPGGIGIRELVFVLIIGQSGLDQNFYFQVITLHRLASVLSDIMIYFLSNYFRTAR